MKTYATISREGPVRTSKPVTIKVGTWEGGFKGEHKMTPGQAIRFAETLTHAARAALKDREGK